MRDHVVYNNPDTVGEIKKYNPLSVYTKKKVSNEVIGDRLWLLTATGKTRQYFLRAWFTIDSIDSGMDKGFRTCISGTEGDLFDPMLPIEDKEWFRDFKKSVANFSIGFSPIRDAEAVRQLQMLVDAAA